jgi:mannose-6-phosphate isomerase-like protein (cupin superfamily)
MPAATQNVVHPDEVEPRREGSAEVRTTFHPGNGCKRLEQRIVRFAPGRSDDRASDGRQELLYVVSGRGAIEVNGERHPLEADTGVFVAAGERYVIDVDEELLVVSVFAPAEAEARGGRRTIVRFEDQPELVASEERRYRYLINEEAGCFDVTQFVGIVDPSKAPLHSHSYDEVGYIIGGEGIAHVDAEELPLRAGSCFHLASEQVHTIENSGTTPMRILGVFHPSGSPASRSHQDNN